MTNFNNMSVVHDLKNETGSGCIQKKQYVNSGPILQQKN